MVFEKETNIYQDGAILSRFNSLDTQFQVVQGKISYLISDSEIEDYQDGSGTITSRMNNAEDTISGHTRQISSISQTISGIDGDLTDFHSTYNSFIQTNTQTISQITETLSHRSRVFYTQPTVPYLENDLWIRNQILYRCAYGKSTGNFSESDWVRATNGNVYSSQPTIPYCAGDVWFQGEDGDILICINTRTSGNFTSTDWEPASRYSSELTDWIEGDFADIVESLEDGIKDSKMETFSQAEDPSLSWDLDEKPNHEGDLWFDTVNQITKRYTGSTWTETKSTPPSAVMNLLDRKGVIYTGSTTPSSANEGDLWFKGTNEPIRTYVNGSWQEFNKYTNDDAFNSWKNTTYSSFIEQLPNQINMQVTGSGSTSAGDVFAAKATLIAEINENTHESGVKISADRLDLTGLVTARSLETAGSTTINGSNITTGYINANRIQGGTLKAGGLNNENGIIEVYEGSTLCGKWDNTGMKVGQIARQTSGNGFRIDTSGSASSIQGSQKLVINEALLTGYYGSTVHGILDLSAQYNDNKIHVALTSKGILDIKATTSINFESAAGTDLLVITPSKITFNKASTFDAASTFNKTVTFEESISVFRISCMTFTDARPALCPGTSQPYFFQEFSGKLYYKIGNSGSWKLLN